MNLEEFLSSIKNKNTLIWGPSNTRAIEFANSNLQQKKCAMLPNQIISLYMRTAGINLGTGYMFGPSELPNGTNFPIPSIVQINEETRNIPTLKNKTVFARNDLFWFVFDSFGTYYMLNNINSNTLRTYDNAYHALHDCLMGGKL